MTGLEIDAAAMGSARIWFCYGKDLDYELDCLKKDPAPAAERFCSARRAR